MPETRPLMPGEPDRLGDYTLTAAPTAMTAPPVRGGHTGGIVLSLIVGVLVGIAAITLVLWPQLSGGEDEGGALAIPAPTSSTANDEPVDSVPAAFNGIWRGTATNQHGASFHVKVTFQEGQRVANVFYPPPANCTGTLTLTEGTRSRLRMTLAIGSPCTNGGTVTVTRRADGTLDYAWAKQRTSLSYRATLSAG